MKAYILTIDQGTSATKAILFDKKGELVCRRNIRHRQFYPKPGWVEHDAEEIFQNVIAAAAGVLEESGVSIDDIAALSVSNQRETAVAWDKTTGRPVCNAVVWQCTRGEEICRELKESGCEEIIRRKTGLVLSPYFSASKVKWMLDNVEGARKKADAGDLLFGTVDSWLLWKLTGGRVHATDPSNASRTQLFNIDSLCWDDELLKLFTIPQSMMPRVANSDEIFGCTDPAVFFGRKIPVAGLMGDSQAALFGQCCFENGMAKATYGTGSSIMMNTGARIFSENGLVTSIAWKTGGKPVYVLEGNINCTGATIKWLVDDLELIKDASQAGLIAAGAEDTDGVYLVPAFVGLGAPYWDSAARAAILGMNRGTKKAHVVRAAEESIAYQVRDVLGLMTAESNTPLKELRVDGGPTRDDFLMQFQADMLGVPVVRNRAEEISAAGSCYMAGLATGFWKELAQIKDMRREDRRYESQFGSDRRARLYAGWKAAVSSVASLAPR